MSQNSNARVKEIAANRNKSAKAAALTNPVTFQDWLFFGQGADVFVNVGIVPASGVVIEYALVVLQTPSEYIVSDAAINFSNPTSSSAFNLATDNGTYNAGTYGNQLQAWAYVVTNQGEQYSTTQNYTVS